MSDTPLLEVTVQRSKWHRGHGHIGSALVVSDRGLLPGQMGKMCCLGFVCRVAGVPVKEMIGVTVPLWLRNLIDYPLMPVALTENLAHSTKNITAKLVDANDDQDLTDAAREQQLICLGREAGINFTFID